MRDFPSSHYEPDYGCYKTEEYDYLIEGDIKREQLDYCVNVLPRHETCEFWGIYGVFTTSQIRKPVLNVFSAIGKLAQGIEVFTAKEVEDSVRVNVLAGVNEGEAMVLFWHYQGVWGSVPGDENPGKGWNFKHGVMPAGSVNVDVENLDSVFGGSRIKVEKLVMNSTKSNSYSAYREVIESLGQEAETQAVEAAVNNQGFEVVSSKILENIGQLYEVSFDDLETYSVNVINLIDCDKDDDLVEGEQCGGGDLDD
ncbi:MAG: hypothetical protein ABH821_06345 [archaeon]